MSSAQQPSDSQLTRKQLTRKQLTREGSTSDPAESASAGENSPAENSSTENTSKGSFSSTPAKKFWPNSDETMALIREAADGDDMARGELLNRHRNPLRRAIDMRLDKRIRQRVDASDIVQNVMVSADRRLAEYFENPEVPFFIWLRQLARDSMIDAHRKHRASQKRSVDREHGRPAATHRTSISDMMTLLSDQNVTPAAAATLVEFKQQFEDALEHLGETDREVLLMRHYEHLNNNEVAQVLEISEHAASMRYVRALRAIGKQLRKLGYSD